MWVPSSLGFWSELWLVHSKTFIFLCRSHSFVDLHVCFIVMMKGESSLHFQLSSRGQKVLCQNRLVLGATHDSLKPWRTAAKSVMLPFFIVGMLFFCWCAKHSLPFTFWPKFQSWSQTITLFSTWFWETGCVFVKFSGVWMFRLVRKGLCLTAQTDGEYGR